MDILYSENTLTAQTLARFRKQAGWNVPSAPQAQKAIENTLYSVTATHNGQVVGIGRLVGDGALIWYIQDLIVLPDFQGIGIGSRLVEALLRYARTHGVEGAIASVGLMAAKGKEAFYEKLGFHVRPNENEGAGMAVKIRTGPDA